MQKLLFGGIALLVLLSLPSVHAQGCSVLTQAGWQSDYDCDGTPDDFDNCPHVPNSQQHDMNRNLIGDVCDVLIEEVIVEPDTNVRQGEFAHLIVRIINNRQGPIGDVQLRVRNGQLGIDAEQTILEVPAGQSVAAEFWLKIPNCASVRPHDLSISSTFREPYTRLQVTEQQSERIFVSENDVCQRAEGPLDNTIINVFGRVDVGRGEDVLIPVTITNRNDGQETYHLSVSDLAGWGSWRIDPAASITLPAGHEGNLYFYIQTEDYTPPGTRAIDLTVTSDNQQTHVPINVYVRAPLQRAVGIGAFVLEAVLILFFMLLVGVIGVFAMLHLNRRHPRKETPKKTRRKVSIEKAEEPKVETYY